MEAADIVFFVRAVDLIVVFAKSDQHGVHAEDFLEISGNGDRAAAADIGSRAGHSSASAWRACSKAGRAVDICEAVAPFFSVKID